MSTEEPKIEILPSVDWTIDRTNFERIKTEYAPAINLRERQYDRDVKQKPDAGGARANLDVHNEIVLDYAGRLVEAQHLLPEQKAAAFLATVFHDSGKLNSELLEHHKKGLEYSTEMLDEMAVLNQSFEGTTITPEIKAKVLQAIERHMNHPFLVVKNKGERFPEPQDDVDKVVFDADMMANIGFKNVCFRLVSEKFLKEDNEMAAQKKIPILQESFENVMQGVKSLDQVVLSKPAKEMTGGLIADATRIFEYLKEKKILDKIQEEFSDNGQFNKQTMVKKAGQDGFLLLKKRLNEEIMNAAGALGIDAKIVKNFQM